MPIVNGRVFPPTSVIANHNASPIEAAFAKAKRAELAKLDCSEDHSATLEKSTIKGLADTGVHPQEGWAGTVELARLEGVVYGNIRDFVTAYANEMCLIRRWSRHGGYIYPIKLFRRLRRLAPGGTSHNRRSKREAQQRMLVAIHRDLSRGQ